MSETLVSSNVEFLSASARDGRLSRYEKHIDPFVVRSARRAGMVEDYVRGWGAYLENAKGERFLDLDAGSGVFNVGRNHPHIQSAMMELLRSDPPNMVHRNISVLSGMLAESLTKRTPGALNKVLFTTSGSETTEVAIKFARIYTGRPRLLYHAGDYHGSTYGALSVTDMPLSGKTVGPLLPGCTRIPAGSLEHLSAELSKNDVAGLIIEPIQGVDVRVLDTEYLRSAQELCRRSGTAFIVDEVFTGFGRTGSLFACDHLQLEPDLLLLSKSFGGGYVPMGALVIRDSIYDKVHDRPGVFVHGSTFEHNDLAMAAGIATLAVFDQERLVNRITPIAEQLWSGLKELQTRHDMIADVRGRGLLVGIEFRAPTAITSRLSGKLLQQRGLLGRMMMMELFTKHRIITTAVVKNNLLRLTPPLTITQEDVDYFLRSFESVLRGARRFPDGIGRFVLAYLLRMARSS